MPRRPRLNYLRAFDAAARRLSFSLAAEEMNLTQAAVSQQIRRLEETLGAPLFIRGNRSLLLSEPGKRYARVVREILARLDTTTDRLFPEPGAQFVSVRCTPSVANWVAAGLGAFHRCHPMIEVHLRTVELSPDPDAAATTDIEIIRLPDGAEPGANTRPLWEAEIFPVCSPSYMNRRGPFAGPTALLSNDLIHILGYRNDWHRWARVFARSAEVPAGLTFDSLTFALDAACRGEGVVLGRRPLIDAHLGDGRLIPALVGDVSLHSPYFVRVGAMTANRRVVRVFVDWLLSAARSDKVSTAD